jgi:hypothetical protein
MPDGALSCTTLNLHCGVCEWQWAEEIPALITLDSVLLRIRSIRCRCCADYHAIFVSAPGKIQQSRVAA